MATNGPTCPKCGAALPGGAESCPKCGAALVRRSRWSSCSTWGAVLLALIIAVLVFVVIVQRRGPRPGVRARPEMKAPRQLPPPELPLPAPPEPPDDKPVGGPRGVGGGRPE
jgi:hypothetical protein